MSLRQDSLGEINPFVQLGHFLTQGIDLGQELGILSGRGSATETICQRPSHRTYRKEEEGSSSEDQSDGEYPFYVHASVPDVLRAGMTSRR
jgi:hypothetical protein